MLKADREDRDESESLIQGLLLSRQFTSGYKCTSGNAVTLMTLDALRKGIEP